MKSSTTDIIGQAPRFPFGLMKKGGPVLPLLLISCMTALALALVVYLNLPSLKRSIIAEVKDGNLTKAYDLYVTSKEHLAGSDVKEIAAVVIPAAEAKCNQMVTRLKQEAADSDWSEAARLYGWLNELKPAPAYAARLYFARARSAFSRKEYAQAIENYQKSIEIDPASALALNGLGRAYWGQKDGAKAREYYQRAIEAEPGWMYPFMNLGGLYFELNDYPAAEQMLQKALTIDPRRGAAHNLLGQVYEKMGRWCDAYGHYAQALASVGSDTSSFNPDTTRNRMYRLQSKNGCGR